MSHLDPFIAFYEQELVKANRFLRFAQKAIKQQRNPLPQWSPQEFLSAAQARLTLLNDLNNVIRWAAREEEHMQ